mmetsp:Transcript_6005/g.23324  ORF Transcript_6005/g.23324 Transcript_6005/m.23324 type:complete len:457 (+) Transcript_6005:100-1470(+)
MATLFVLAPLRSLLLKRRPQRKSTRASAKGLRRFRLDSSLCRGLQVSCTTKVPHLALLVRRRPGISSSVFTALKRVEDHFQHLLQTVNMRQGCARWAPRIAQRVIHLLPVLVELRSRREERAQRTAYLERVQNGAGQQLGRGDQASIVNDVLRTLIFFPSDAISPQEELLEHTLADAVVAPLPLLRHLRVLLDALERLQGNATWAPELGALPLALLQHHHKRVEAFLWGLFQRDAASSIRRGRLQRVLRKHTHLLRTVAGPRRRSVVAGLGTVAPSAVWLAQVTAEGFGPLIDGPAGRKDMLGRRESIRSLVGLRLSEGIRQRAFRKRHMLLVGCQRRLLAVGRLACTAALFSPPVPQLVIFVVVVIVNDFEVQVEGGLHLGALLRAALLRRRGSPSLMRERICFEAFLRPVCSPFDVLPVKAVLALPGWDRKNARRTSIYAAWCHGRAVSEQALS